MKKLFFIVSLLYSISNVLAQGSTSCDTAVPIETGVHTSDNSRGSQWFAYTNTNTKTEIVKVSSCGYTTEDTFVRGTFQCSGLAAKANDDICGAQSEIEITVSPSQTVLIEWLDLYTSASFQWQLTSTPAQAGELCSLPVTITPGLNTSVNPGKQQWYMYTNQSAEEQLISFTGNNENVLIFYSDCETAFTSGVRYDYLISPGESMLVMYEGSDAWIFEVRTPQTGDQCVIPQPAAIGTNIPNFYSNMQWFSFTNESETEKVVETTTGIEFQYIILYDDCTSEIPLRYSTHGHLSYITAPGQTLLFMTSYAEHFNVNVRNTGPGDYCDNPVISREGLNFNSHPGMDQWYIYTNTTGQTREITVATNEDSYIRVYNSCSPSPVHTFQYDFTVTLSPSESVYFLMGRAKIYSVDIGNELQGDKCTHPIPAHYGINYPNIIMKDQWFEYTNDTEETEYIYIDNGGYWTHDLRNKFALLQNCEQDVPFLSRSSSGWVALHPEQSMLIHWLNVSSWTMSPYQPVEGENCSFAQSLSAGIHQADNQEGDHWYTYRNETSDPQFIEISSCGYTSTDTDVALYGDCEGTIIAESDDDCSSQSKLNYTIMPEEVVYVRWKNSYNRTTYAWKFDVDNVLALPFTTEKTILVYPTSSDGTYHFSQTVESVSVFNSVGTSIHFAENTNSVSILNCPPGIYFLKLNTGTETKTIRVQKS